MEFLKIDLDSSKKIYHSLKNIIEKNECYNNSYKVISSIPFLSEFNKDSYKVGYGFISRLINGKKILFRHSFIVRNTDNMVIDVTACLWNNVESEYHTYEYYVFKEYDDIDEYTNDIIQEDMLPALNNICKYEEVEMRNNLVNNYNYIYNFVDEIGLLKRMYLDSLLH